MGGSKFSSLAVGRRFRYGDGLYVKVSPLLARAEADGASRMIPRSALVEALDGSGADSPDATDDCARAVLADYHRSVLACLDALAQTPSAQAVTAARDTLNAAHARALKRLGAPR